MEAGGRLSTGRSRLSVGVEGCREVQTAVVGGSTVPANMHITYGIGGGVKSPPPNNIIFYLTMRLKKKNEKL